MSWLTKFLGGGDPPVSAKAVTSPSPVAERVPSLGGWAGEYDVFVVVTNGDENAPWLTLNWEKAARAVDPLMHLARGPAAVRSTQLSKDSGTPNQRGLSFGRIGWNAAGVNKWTHSVPGRLASGQEAEFLETEIWAPSWNACGRENQAPDVYISVGSRNGSEVWGGLVLAVAHSAGHEALAAARTAVSELRSTLDARFAATWTRPWSFPFGSEQLRTGSINDLLVSGLYVRGALPTASPGLGWFDGPWQPFD